MKAQLVHTMWANICEVIHLKNESHMTTILTSINIIKKILNIIICSSSSSYIVSQSFWFLQTEIF